MTLCSTKDVKISLLCIIRLTYEIWLQILGPKLQVTLRTGRKEKKSIQLKFESNSPNLSKFFSDLMIMKFKDVVTLSNCIFFHDQTNKTLSNTFENYFCKKKDQHNHKTRGAENVLLGVPTHQKHTKI